MPSHKFEYIVSGVKLTEEQKSAISAAIAAAVSKTLIGGDASLIAGKVWSIINGRQLQILLGEQAAPGVKTQALSKERFLPNGGWLAIAADEVALMQQINKPNIAIGAGTVIK